MCSEVDSRQCHSCGSRTAAIFYKDINAMNATHSVKCSCLWLGVATTSSNQMCDYVVWQYMTIHPHINCMFSNTHTLDYTTLSHNHSLSQEYTCATDTVVGLELGNQEGEGCRLMHVWWDFKIWLQLFDLHHMHGDCSVVLVNYN